MRDLFYYRADGHTTEQNYRASETHGKSVRGVLFMA